MPFEIRVWGVLLMSILLGLLMGAWSSGADIPEYLPEARVDVIERNHVYDMEGRHSLTQLIFWVWDYGRSDHAVAAWRSSLSGPVRRGVMVLDRSDQLILVRSASRQRSWTQHDPETFDREKTPQERRRTLLGTPFAAPRPTDYDCENQPLPGG